MLQWNPKFVALVIVLVVVAAVAVGFAGIHPAGFSWDPSGFSWDAS